MRLLVTGSRNWTNFGVIKKALRMFALQPYVTVVHGGAEGADEIADFWARAFGFRTEAHPAGGFQWVGTKPAPLVRNDHMLDSLDPAEDMVLAFMLGKPARGGTLYTVNGARERGIRTIVYHWPGDKDYREAGR